MPRGRKPQPTRILQLRGSKYAKTRRGEVQPPPAHLEPPEWLSEQAKAHWQATVPDLASVGLFTQIDVSAWSLACETWAQGRALTELIARDGLVLPTEDGGGRLHPALHLEQKFYANYFKMACEFGMTPRSRVGLNVHVKQPDALDEFLNRKHKDRFFRTRVTPGKETSS